MPEKTKLNLDKSASKDFIASSPMFKNINSRMSEDAPLISIITVVYNGVSFLEKTIMSVINQDYEHIEYIIIDGGSTDGTLELIKKYENNIDAWISEKDQGIYDAMNKGCRLAKGKAITFLNAGDYYVGNVFDPSMEFPCFLDCLVMSASGRLRPMKISPFKFGMPTSHQAIIYLNTRQIYNLNYKISSDLDFTLRANISYNTKIYNNGYVVYDNTGISAQKYWRRDYETFLILLRRKGFFFGVAFALKQIPKNIVRAWIL